LVLSGLGLLELPLHWYSHGRLIPSFFAYEDLATDNAFI
jgi:hypothetical protein